MCSSTGSRGVLAFAVLEVPCLSFNKTKFWHALTLAAVRIPEHLLAVFVWASLDLTDLAFASLLVELLVWLSAGVSGERAVTFASSTHENVGFWARLSLEFAISGEWVEELAWWASFWLQDGRARDDIPDVIWRRLLVRADA